MIADYNAAQSRLAPLLWYAYQTRTTTVVSSAKATRPPTRPVKGRLK